MTKETFVISLITAVAETAGGNGSHAMGSPLFHSPDGFTGELEEGVLQGLHGDQNEELLRRPLRLIIKENWEKKLKRGLKLTS